MSNLWRTWRVFWFLPPDTIEFVLLLAPPLEGIKTVTKDEDEDDEEEGEKEESFGKRNYFRRGVGWGGGGRGDIRARASPFNGGGVASLGTASAPATYFDLIKQFIYHLSFSFFFFFRIEKRTPEPLLLQGKLQHLNPPQKIIINILGSKFLSLKLGDLGLPSPKKSGGCGEHCH